MTLTTTNMSLLQAQGSDNARDYLATYLANSLGLIDTHDHSSGKGVAVLRLQNGTFASRPAAGHAGHVYVATDSNRVTWDNGASWIEAVINGTTQAVTLGGGLTINGGSLVASSGGLQVNSTGNIGIGGAPSTQDAILVNGLQLTGATTTQGLFMSVVGASDATVEVSAVTGRAGTNAAATFALNAAFHALNPTKFAGSTITRAVGLVIDPITNGATNHAIGMANNNPIAWLNGAGTSYDTITFDGSDRLVISGAATGAASAATGSVPIVINGVARNVLFY